jgi:hypothetical protein
MKPRIGCDKSRPLAAYRDRLDARGIDHLGGGAQSLAHRTPPVLGILRLGPACAQHGGVWDNLQRKLDAVAIEDADLDARRAEIDAGK